ncbi:hypothetical protein [Ascidiimonas sp. W6]|uniref:hypothetical protein n=1 Tax=Ascidiimonas meishanensis TaxID=3128903 RepID=UPI0030EC5D4F
MKKVIVFIGIFTGILFFSSCSSDDDGEQCTDKVALLGRSCIVENEGQENEQEVCQYTVGYIPVNSNNGLDDLTQIQTNEATYNFYNERFDVFDNEITCWEGEK